MHTSHRGMILLMMFCAHIASWYDSTDDVLCTHRIAVWFYWPCSVHASHWLYDSTDDVQCTHHIVLWFYRWCSGLTSNRPYDSRYDNNSYNASRYDSRKEFICSLGIRVMIPQMILCVHIALQRMIQRWSFYVTKWQHSNDLLLFKYDYCIITWITIDD